MGLFDETAGGAATGYPGLLAQARRARQIPRPLLETAQQNLDLAAGMTLPIPIVGDVVGLAADVNRFKENPEERTLGNFGLSAMGLLPFIPGMTAIKNAKLKQTSFPKINPGDNLGPFVSGEKVDNLGSISASLEPGYFVEKGIQSVPLKFFYEGKQPNLSVGMVDEIKRTKDLAEKIRTSKRMDPLIVAIDEKGPYVLEGGHRLDAAYLLGAKEIPAIIVREKGIPVFENAASAFKAPRDEALKIAQKNAAKPVSEGGLGLRPDNTPMERARAMDYEDKVFRGSTADEKSARLSTGWEHGVKGVSTSPNANYAQMHGDVLMPLLAKKGNKIDFFDLIESFEKKTGKDAFDATDAQIANFAKENGFNASVFRDPIAGTDVRYLDPSHLRSRFAAFDPAKRNSSDLLAGLLAPIAGLGLLYGGQSTD